MIKKNSINTILILLIFCLISFQAKTLTANHLQPGEFTQDTSGGNCFYGKVSHIIDILNDNIKSFKETDLDNDFEELYDFVVNLAKFEGKLKSTGVNSQDAEETISAIRSIIDKYQPSLNDLNELGKLISFTSDQFDSFMSFIWQEINGIAVKLAIGKETPFFVQEDFFRYLKYGNVVTVMGFIYSNTELCATNINADNFDELVRDLHHETIKTQSITNQFTITKEQISNGNINLAAWIKHSITALSNGKVNVFSIISGINKISLDLSIAEDGATINSILSVGLKEYSINHPYDCTDLLFYTIVVEKQFDNYVFRLIIKSAFTNDRQGVSVPVKFDFIENATITFNLSTLLSSNTLYKVDDMTCDGKGEEEIVRRELQVLTQLMTSNIKQHFKSIKSNCVKQPDCKYTENNLCVLCKDGKVNHLGKCVNFCPDGYFESNGNCKKCDDNCATCSQENVCTGCLETEYLYLTKCVKTCPSFTWPSDGVCISCTNDCDICSGINTCSQCKTLFLYKSSCIETCPKGTYQQVSPKKCLNCPSECSECTQQDKCTSCNAGFYLHNNQCLSTCPLQYFGNPLTNQCEKCSDYCEKCESSTICKDCLDSYNLSNDKCLNQCPSGTVSINGVCVDCSKNCLICHSSDTNTCEKCSSMFYLKNGKCVADCGVGFFANSNGVCTQCFANCLKCSSTTTCDSCTNGFSLYNNNQCVNPCPLGFVGIDGVCIQCNQTNNCRTCCPSNKDKCTTCYSGFVYYDHLCLKECPSNTFQEQNVCKNCDPSCLTCSNATTCTSCPPNQYLKEGKCVSSCGDGYLPNQSKCAPCLTATCKNCDLGADSCINCIEGYVNLNGNCLESCPPFFFNNFGVCEKCIDNCIACKSKTECEICNIDYFQQPITKICDKKCPDGYITNTLGSCTKCTESSCKTCDSTLSVCLTCPAGQYLYEGKCVVSCPAKITIANLANMKCENCQAPCKECINTTDTCSDCINNYVLTQDRKCTDKCPDYQANVNQVCTNCTDKKCLVCSNTDLSSCLKCDNYLLGSKCYDVCPKTYYPNSTSSCNKCIDNCNVCENNRECLICSEGYSLFMNQCTLGCPDGYVSIEEEVGIKVCEKCDTGCKTCEVSNTSNCITCLKNFFLHNDQCIEACPVGYYSNDVNECKKCNTDLCSTCSDSGKTCQQCTGKLVIFENSCVEKCPSGHRSNGTYCESCLVDNCDKCTNDRQICNKCKSNFFKLSDTKCSETCPDGTYELPSEQLCPSCDSDCLKCFSSTRCYECKQNFFLREDDTCNTSCPLGQVGSPNGKCEFCGANCNTCNPDNTSKCFTCMSGFYLTPSQECVKTCPQGYYPNNENKQCDKCSVNCASCLILNKCDVCDNKFLMLKGTCTDKCPSGYVQVNELCVECNTQKECVKCSKDNVDICVNCGDLILFEGKCINNCPETYRELSNKTCEKCLDNCKTCSQTHTCDICTPGYYLYNESTCLLKCPSGYVGINGKCETCDDSNCFTCDTNKECTKCNDSYFLLNIKGLESQCVLDCGKNYYPLDGKCVGCSDLNCEVCPGVNKCDSCKNNTSLLNNSHCVHLCPIGMVSINGVCESCEVNCEECDSRNKKDCLKCNKNTILYVGDCVEKCPEGFVKSKEKPEICTSCPDNCSICCSKVPTNCKICDTGFYLNKDNQCVKDCGDKYTPSASKCAPCTVTECKTCVSLDNKCEKCTGDNILSLLRDNCIPSCPLGEYDFNGQCQKCQGCPDCQKDTGKCNSCYNGYFLTSEGTCKQDCVDGQVRIGDNCNSCNDSAGCKACQSEDLSSCITCYDTHFIYNNKCYEDCPAGTYPSITNSKKECKNCKSNCGVCINDTSCNKCNDNFVYQAPDCLDKCNPGYVSINSICKECGDSQRCQQCDSKNKDQCIVCKKGYIEKSGVCVDDCKEGFFIKDNGEMGKTCVKCNENCSTCENALTCKVCITGFVLYDGDCILTCPVGYNKLNGVCEKCKVDRCSECASKDVTFCDKCVGDFVLLNNECVENCGKGYYVDSNNICQKCTDPNCLACSSTSCSDCKDGFFLYDGKCLEKCPSGYTSNSSDVCVKCQQVNCNDCNASNLNKCTDCILGYLLNGVCYVSCPNEYYPNGKICSPCFTGCDICSNSNNCSKCISPKKLNNNDCVSTCPDSTYPIDGICQPCYDSNCLQCTSDLGICLSCKSPMVVHETKCVKDCPEGYFSNGTKCTSCEDNCLECTDSTTCTKCSEKFFLFASDCKEKCPEYTYHTSDNKCEWCSDSEKCEKCCSKDPSKCLKCNSSILYKDKCINQCPVGTYYCNKKETCIDCSESCTSCQSKTQCDSCKTGFYLLNGQCISECPSGYVVVGNECKKCDNCLTCLSVNLSNCLSCNDEKYLHDNKCIDNCPKGTFPTILKDQKICQNCNNTCETCERADSCITCKEPLVKFISGNIISCDDKCQGGYININGTCTPCSDIQKCSTCSKDNLSECIDCKEGFYLHNKQCVSICPKGTFENNQSKTCDPCLVSCETCSDSSTCDTCLSGLYFVENKKTCDKCNDKNVIINNECKSCKVNNCDNCDSSDDYTCSICKSGFVLYNNQCLEDCPYKMFKVGQLCYDCGVKCLECSSYKSCNLCEGLNVIYDGNCVEACPVGYSANKNAVCVKCSVENCTSCDGDRPNICKECPSNSILHDNKCISECPTGYVHSNNSCIKCSEKCNSCNITECEQCSEGFYLKNGICVNSCGESFYKDDINRTCNNCSSAHCKTCDKINCSLCEDNFILFDGKCVTFCPDGYYKEALINTCMPCKSGCKVCTSQFNCSECKDESLILFNTNCIPNCPDSMTKINNTCEPCTDTNCFKCELGHPDRCEACNKNYLYEKICIEDCPEGTFMNIAKKECTACDNTCKSCRNINSCDSCFPGFSLFENKCISECPDKYVKYESTCIPCGKELCDTCTVRPSGIECLQCEKPSLLYNNECVSGCPKGTYQSENKCLKCEFGCDSCLDENTCLKCKANFFFYKGNCLQGCPSGTWGNCDSHECDNCSSACSTCYGGSSSDCYECSKDFIKQDETCVSNNQCHLGYFANSYTCDKCLVPFCSECTTASHCIKCENHFYLKDGRCSLEGTVKAITLNTILETPFSFKYNQLAEYNLDSFSSIGSTSLSLSFWIRSLGIRNNISSTEISTIMTLRTKSNSLNIMLQVINNKCGVQITKGSVNLPFMTLTDCSDSALEDWKSMIISIHTIGYNEYSLELILKKNESYITINGGNIIFNDDSEYILDSSSVLTIFDYSTIVSLGYQISKISLSDFKPTNQSISKLINSIPSPSTQGFIQLTQGITDVNTIVNLYDNNQYNHNSVYTSYQVSFFILITSSSTDNYNLFNISYKYDSTPINVQNLYRLRVDKSLTKTSVENGILSIPDVLKPNKWYAITSGAKVDLSLRQIIYSIDIQDFKLFSAILSESITVKIPENQTSMKLYIDASCSFGDSGLTGQIFNAFINVNNYSHSQKSLLSYKQIDACKEYGVDFTCNTCEDGFSLSTNKHACEDDTIKNAVKLFNYYESYNRNQGEYSISSNYKSFTITLFSRKLVHSLDIDADQIIHNVISFKDSDGKLVNILTESIHSDYISKLYIGQSTDEIVIDYHNIDLIHQQYTILVDSATNTITIIAFIDNKEYKSSLSFAANITKLILNDQFGTEIHYEHKLGNIFKRLLTTEEIDTIRSKTPIKTDPTCVQPDYLTGNCNKCFIGNPNPSTCPLSLFGILYFYQYGVGVNSPENSLYNLFKALPKDVNSTHYGIIGRFNLTKFPANGNSILLRLKNNSHLSFIKPENDPSENLISIELEVSNNLPKLVLKANTAHGLTVTSPDNFLFSTNTWILVYAYIDVEAKTFNYFLFSNGVSRPLVTIQLPGKPERLQSIAQMEVFGGASLQSENLDTLHGIVINAYIIPNTTSSASSLVFNAFLNNPKYQPVQPTIITNCAYNIYDYGAKTSFCGKCNDGYLLNNGQCNKSDTVISQNKTFNIMSDRILIDPIVNFNITDLFNPSQLNICYYLRFNYLPKDISYVIMRIGDVTISGVIINNIVTITIHAGNTTHTISFSTPQIILNWHYMCLSIESNNISLYFKQAFSGIETNVLASENISLNTIISIPSKVTVYNSNYFVQVLNLHVNKENYGIPLVYLPAYTNYPVQCDLISEKGICLLSDQKITDGVPDINYIKLTRTKLVVNQEVSYSIDDLVPSGKYLRSSEYAIKFIFSASLSDASNAYVDLVTLKYNDSNSINVKFNAVSKDSVSIQYSNYHTNTMLLSPPIKIMTLEKAPISNYLTLILNVRDNVIDLLLYENEFNYNLITITVDGTLDNLTNNASVVFGKENVKVTKESVEFGSVDNIKISIDQSIDYSNILNEAVSLKKTLQSACLESDINESCNNCMIGFKLINTNAGMSVCAFDDGLLFSSGNYNMKPVFNHSPIIIDYDLSSLNNVPIDNIIILTSFSVPYYIDGLIGIMNLRLNDDIIFALITENDTLKVHNKLSNSITIIEDVLKNNDKSGLITCAIIYDTNIGSTYVKIFNPNSNISQSSSSTGDKYTIPSINSLKATFAFTENEYETTTGNYNFNIGLSDIYINGSISSKDVENIAINKGSIDICNALCKTECINNTCPIGKIIDDVINISPLYEEKDSNQNPLFESLASRSGLISNYEFKQYRIEVDFDVSAKTSTSNTNTIFLLTNISKPEYNELTNQDIIADSLVTGDSLSVFVHNNGMLVLNVFNDQVSWYSLFPSNFLLSSFNRINLQVYVDVEKSEVRVKVQMDNVLNIFNISIDSKILQSISKNSLFFTNDNVGYAFVDVLNNSSVFEIGIPSSEITPKKDNCSSATENCFKCGITEDGLICIECKAGYSLLNEVCVQSLNQPDKSISP